MFHHFTSNLRIDPFLTYPRLGIADLHYVHLLKDHVLSSSRAVLYAPDSAGNLRGSSWWSWQQQLDWAHILRKEEEQPGLIQKTTETLSEIIKCLLKEKNMPKKSSELKTEINFIPEIHVNNVQN